MVEGYVEFDYYLDFENQLKSKFIDWFDNPAPVSGIRPNQLPVHSYVVFGVDRWKTADLYDVIEAFSNEAGWKPRIISDLGSLSKIESLAIQVSQRSFCIFCLDGYDSEKIFLGIGLAMGMGRPFLIIKAKNISLPIVLQGYHGVIEYENYSQLRYQLTKYAKEFLTSEVFQWEGATYNDLLARLEKRIDNLNPTSLSEFERVLITVASISGDITAKPFALLGEIYREKNRKTSPENTELLRKAKEFYEKALNIQKDYQLYQNAITAIEKHIQLIELIKDKKYRSIPTLINLIGGELKSDHYFQVKEYLLNVVNRLIEEKEFAHAISLLVAMQIHDKSPEIQKLVQQVLNLAPSEIIKALQDTQKLVVELEGEKNQLTNDIKEKANQLEKLTGEIETSKNELKTTNRNLERIQKERDDLSSKLMDISSQLGVVDQKVNKLKTEIEMAKSLGGRGVLVNFGYGWAVYEALNGDPRIFRNKQQVPVKKGFVFQNGDTLYDATGVKDSYIGSESIVIHPDSELYSVIKNWLSQHPENLGSKSTIH